MYSLIAYFVAFKTIDVTIDGLNETKSVLILSDYYEDISEAIRDRLGRESTIFESINDGNRTFAVFCSRDKAGGRQAEGNRRRI